MKQDQINKKLNLIQKHNKNTLQQMNTTEQKQMNTTEQKQMNTAEQKQMKKLNLIQKNNIIAMDNINSKQNIESKKITELTEKLAELNQIIVKYNITEGNLIKEKNELEQQFNTLNVNNQNNLNMKAFAKKIIEKEHNIRKHFKKSVKHNFFCILNILYIIPANT